MSTDVLPPGHGRWPGPRRRCCAWFRVRLRTVALEGGGCQALLKLYVTKLDPRSSIVDTVPFWVTWYWCQSSVTSVLTHRGFVKMSHDQAVVPGSRLGAHLTLMGCRRSTSLHCGRLIHIRPLRVTCRGSCDDARSGGTSIPAILKDHTMKKRREGHTGPRIPLIALPRGHVVRSPRSRAITGTARAELRPPWSMSRPTVVTDPDLISSPLPILCVRWTLEREKAPQRTMVRESMNNG